MSVEHTQTAPRTALPGTPLDPAAADPFAWLEDVDGDTALSWVRERNAHSAQVLDRPRLHRDRACGARGPRLGRQDPARLEGRRALLQLLAGRRARARPVAPHDPRLLPHRRPRVGDGPRPRRPRGAGGRELGLARRERPAPDGGAARRGRTAQARAGRPVPRRVRLRRDARVRPRHQAVRARERRRLRARAGQGRAVLDRRRHGLRVHGLRRGHDDAVGLPAAGEALAPRHSSGRGGPRLRGHRAGHVHQRVPLAHPGLRARPGAPRPAVLRQRVVPGHGRGHPRTGPHQDRRAGLGERRPAPRVDAGAAARRLDDRPHDLRRGLAARRPLRRLHGRVARPDGPVRADADDVARRDHLDAEPPGGQRARRREEPAARADAAHAGHPGR